jgi:hypothetical protein
MKMTTEHIAEFFTQVKSFEAKHWAEKIEVEQSAFLALHKQFLLHKPEFDTLRKSEAPYFNLFQVLNIRHREETLHTPMLDHLLDPYGTHEQGELYLNAFLKHVLGLTISFGEISNYTITEELNTDNGRIDIILRYRYQGRKKMIVIENKIYAGDQQDQLLRYYQYAKSVLACKNDLLLVYLTPNGKRATAYSMPLDIQEELRKMGLLKEISYHHHITPWLEASLQLTTAVNIKQVIIQYLTTLYQL